MMSAPRQKGWSTRVSVLAFIGLLACDGSSGASGGAEGRVRSGTQAAVTGTGVSECDAYLTAYEGCINAVVTGSANQAAALEGLNKNRADWAALADDPAKKEALARMCSRAQLDLAENSCSWTPAGAGGAGSGGGGGGSGASGGTGGSGGGGACDAGSATPLGGPDTLFTVAANACFKLNPDSTPRRIKLQRQTGTTATLPLTFAYRQNSGAGCATQGTLRTGAFGSPDPDALTPPASGGGAGTFNTTCPVVYSLQGSGASQLKFKYWYQ